MCPTGDVSYKKDEFGDHGKSGANLWDVLDSDVLDDDWLGELDGKCARATSKG